MRQTLAITRKELQSYFGSPMALIFLGVFLAATLFSFFWIDTFFARGIADVRPLFRWMPLLLIFLVAALTMRQWSEEQQQGTLEILLTLPIRPVQLVIGKFLAVMILIILALALTLFLPYTVDSLGNLDWGPAIGGYLAAILMAAAYAAIGLYISSRTDNQIVALILTTVVCGLFYMVGTRGVTEFAGETIGGIMRAFATGSRFESIERGVVDIRDLVYYLSLAILFLSLNVLSLDTKRWSAGEHTANYQFNALLGTGLLAVNLIALNVWLYPLNGIRLDMTENQEYTLSPTTEDLLGNLQEPLLIRAYFSERTHPLLSPLVPRITDMLYEYEVASQGNVTLEIVDPAQNPDLEAEANQSYGIRPTPFQIAGRYESGVVNAYFNILIRYGDQSEVLGFQDLIEVEPYRDGQLDVRLRNLEYDLTRSIKKTVFGFQNIESILASLTSPAELTLYVTPDTLPPELADADIINTVQTLADEISVEAQSSAPDKFTFRIVDPTDPNSEMNPQALLDTYGIQPFQPLFSPTSYYMHMILQVGDQASLIYPTGDLGPAELRTSVESSLKRFSSGFLKVVGVWQPTIGPDPTLAQFGQTQQPPFSTWNTMIDQLRQDYEVRPVDLSLGQVAADIDVLVVVAPQGMDDRVRYAIDQYLMRGGSVVLAGNNYTVKVDPFTGELALEQVPDGMRDVLDHYGINVQDTMVMDTFNEPFPITVQRDVGGFTVQEIQSIPYPYFVDVRSDGMSDESAIISNLQAVTLNWVSPVKVDEVKNSERDWSVLLQSTEASWRRDSTDIQPNTELYPEYGFPLGDQQGSEILAVSVQGSFNSFFADKESPLDGEPPPPNPNAPQGLQNPPQEGPTPATIAQSPESARLVVIGSGYFLNDTVFTISSQISFDGYLNSLQLVQNAVDWSVEDLDLLSIRSRGTHTRILDPLLPEEQTRWEVFNYLFALIALVVLGFVWNTRRKNEQPMTLVK
ncbi:MAG: Gldg family protein [Chloroflexota bacterium]